MLLSKATYNSDRMQLRRIKGLAQGANNNSLAVLGLNSEPSDQLPKDLTTEPSLLASLQLFITLTAFI